MKTRFTLPGFTLDIEPAVKELQNSPKNDFAKAWKGFQAKCQSGQIGFYDWPKTISVEDKSRIKETARKLKQEFEGAVLFGIGGSYLGPFAVIEALETEPSSFPLHWVSNTDSHSIEKALRFAKAHRSAGVVISKSGNTTETLSAFYHLSSLLDPTGYVLITDPKNGELRRLANKYQWTNFPVPPNIGGRFSVLTAVGLVPFELAGLNTDAILKGAEVMRHALESISPEENPAAIFADLCWQWDQKKVNLHYLMPYEARLRPLADWFVQLWGESIGKKLLKHPDKAVGFTPASALGTSDQHSLLQLFKEGPRDKLIGFLDVHGQKKQTPVQRPQFDIGDFEYLCRHSFEEISHLALRATEKSLNNSSVPTYRVEMKEVNPEAIGAFLFFMETACALAGEIYEVDAFNQPGVEEAKKLLLASL